MTLPVRVDDQPISETFFGEGRWLTEFITPNNLSVQALHAEITDGITDMEEKMIAMRRWVASNVRYVDFVSGKLWIEGKTSRQSDLWNLPSTTLKVGVGNCANMSFLLTSLARQELEPSQVYCVLGNLYNGKVGGHAWTEVNLYGQRYIMESTILDIPDLVPVSTERYEAVHLFNDSEVYAYPDRTVMQPFSRKYSTWLREYLNWDYIKGG